MNMLTRVFVVVNAVFALLFLAMTFTLWSKEIRWVEAATEIAKLYNDTTADLERLRQDSGREIGDLTARLDKRDADFRVLEVQYEDRNAEARRLEAVTRDNSERLGEISSGIQTLTALNEQYKGDLEKAGVELAGMRGQLLEARQGMEASLDQARGMAKELVAQNDMYRELQKAIHSLREENALLRDALAKSGQGFMPLVPREPVRAQVARVDPENKLVVITAGEAAGVLKGMQFMILNAEGWLGRAEIVYVEAEQSVGSILPLTPEANIPRITAGDAALTDEGY
jgi:hypothetical protein